MNMKAKLLKLADIDTYAGTQVRAKIDEDTVANYAEAMLDAANKFPPVVVFHDGNRNILADGFHRVMAAMRNMFADIEADVRKGTKSDALRYALGANCTHGKPRTNNDKRSSVELALREWPNLSDRELARICGVSHMLVADARKSALEESANAPAEKRTCSDGREYPAKRKPAAREEAQPRPADREESPVADNTAGDIREAAKEPEAPTLPVMEPEPEDEPSGDGGLEELMLGVCALAREITLGATNKQVAGFMARLRGLAGLCEEILQRGNN